jgi:hypothetical protein
MLPSTAVNKKVPSMSEPENLHGGHLVRVTGAMCSLHAARKVETDGFEWRTGESDPIGNPWKNTSMATRGHSEKKPYLIS